MNTSDVVIAVASPPGRSARGIVRLSGASLDRLVGKLLFDCAGMPLAVSRACRPARFRLTDSLTLPVLALIAPAPRSYTGEDVVELQQPGHPVLLERIVDRIIHAGAAIGLSIRRAEGGEFTARAFFNGRIGLTEAEGVAATISARSDAELRAASMLRNGSLGRLAHSLADELATALALVEAGIDFTDEEDVVAISPRDLYQRLVALRDRITQTLERSVGMEQLESIPWVVLTGPTNAGKSTLFNALLGRERAVVSEIAGTTRDVLMEPLTIRVNDRPCEVMLVDLAGDDDDPATINQLMQQAASDARARAELVLHCVPADEALTNSPSSASPVETLLVRTKVDRAPIRESKRPESAGVLVEVSAITGEGIDDVRAVIAARLADRAVALAGDLVALGPRHEAAMRSAAAHLDEAVTIVEPMRDSHSLDDPEIVAAAMRAALNDLADLAGDITPDDVLGRIFSTFCVGK
jgi:tRNA modification GTPase